MNYNVCASVLGAECGGPAIGAWPTTQGGRLVPHKGGGGGNDAQKIENDRRKRAQEAYDAINRIFDNADRDKLYQEQRDAVYQMNADEVNRQAADAERLNRFALARNSLIGGSAQIDSEAELNRRTNEGLSKAGGIADEAAASLQAADENTRNNLISMATGGTEATEAAKLAASGLSQNLSNSMVDRSVATVGSLFNDLSNAYLTQNLSKYAQQIYNNYGAYLNQNKNKGDTQDQYQGS